MTETLEEKLREQASLARSDARLWIDEREPELAKHAADVATLFDKSASELDLLRAKLTNAYARCKLEGIGHARWKKHFRARAAHGFDKVRRMLKRQGEVIRERTAHAEALESALARATDMLDAIDALLPHGLPNESERTALDRVRSVLQSLHVAEANVIRLRAEPRMLAVSEAIDQAESAARRILDAK